MDTKELMRLASLCPIRAVSDEEDVARVDFRDDPDMCLRVIKMRWDDGTVEKEFRADDVVAARTWWRNHGVVV